MLIPTLTQGGMSKLAMDISNMNVNPFFQSLNSAQGQDNDDTILLQTAEDQSRGSLTTFFWASSHLLY